MWTSKKLSREMSALYVGSRFERLPTIHEHEAGVSPMSCVDLFFFLVKRTLNMNHLSSNFYLAMNSNVMQKILDDLGVGAGVFSP